MSRRRPPEQTAAPFVPARLTKSALEEAAAGCTACDLYRHATQTVFGEGLLRAAILLVGEQPGDQEDRQGRPFVGPAGRVLDEALEGAGLTRRDVFVTNAVKHFKFSQRGKRRLHQKPDVAEIEICNPWLVAEILLVKPKVVVALGATAVRGVMGRARPIARSRGRLLETPHGPRAVVTYHPSMVLRAPDPAARRRYEAVLVEDLSLARAAADGAAAS